MEAVNLTPTRPEFDVLNEHLHALESSFKRAQAFVYFQRRFWNAAALFACDALTLTAILFVAGAVRWQLYGEPMIPSWSWLLILAWGVSAFGARLLPSWGLGAVEELRRTILMLITVYGGVAIVLFFQKQSEEVSRLVIFIALFLSLPLIPLNRMFVKKLLVRMKIWGVPTVIYGDEKTSRAVVKSLLENKGFGYVPVGVFNSRLYHSIDEIQGVPVLGDSKQFAGNAPVAILAVPDIARERLVELLDGPLSFYRHVIIIPNLFEVQSLWVKTRDLGGVLGLEVSRNLLDPLASRTKQLFEFSAVALSAIFWFPLCAILGILIWLESRASPFFLQERIGENGGTFRTWKFRTMIPNAETVLRERLAEDENLRREWEANYKLKNDPRITKIGAILRKTSLDELPQLINVLRGEMSLVGPRPLPDYHHNELNSQTKSLRERVRPGLTGLWQVSGRSDAGTVGMQRWDTYYVRNWSVWLDIVILVRTIQTVIKGGGAY